jgi:hypothetical protein
MVNKNRTNIELGYLEMKLLIEGINYDRIDLPDHKTLVGLEKLRGLGLIEACYDKEQGIDEYGDNWSCVKSVEYNPNGKGLYVAGELKSQIREQLNKAEQILNQLKTLMVEIPKQTILDYNQMRAEQIHALDADTLKENQEKEMMRLQKYFQRFYGDTLLF